MEIEINIKTLTFKNCSLCTKNIKIYFYFLFEEGERAQQRKERGEKH